jgi:hypothetical protein
MTAGRAFYRADESHKGPGSGFRLVIRGETFWLNPKEKQALAQQVLAQQLLGASQIQIEDTCLNWLHVQRHVNQLVNGFLEQSGQMQHLIPLAG